MNIKEYEHYEAQEHFSGCKKCQRIVDKVILSELKKNRIGLSEKVGKIIDIVWKEMTNRTFNNTMKDKKSVFDVSEKDWDNASFTIKEFKKKIINLLTNKVVK